MSSNRDQRPMPEWRGGPFGGPSFFQNNYSQTNEYRIPLPSVEEMNSRWNFRESMLQDTENHRRAHAHTGGMRARNILEILYDRECRSARAIQLVGKRPRFSGDNDETSPGDKSPATVVESPNSTTQATNLYDMSVVNEPEPEQVEPVIEEESDDTPAPNIPSFLLNETKITDDHLQRAVYPTTIAREVRAYSEYTSCTRYHSSYLGHLGGSDEIDAEGNRHESSRSVSTISIAFSPDSQTIASTHGDHTVKISSCNTGRLLQTLDGHPRTPWTVKYHPANSDIIASGCLGHQVRVWDWTRRACLQMVRLDFAIISVSFHPSGKLLAVANGSRLHFWGLDMSRINRDTNQEASSNTPPTLTDHDQRHMLRCVYFPPDGKTIIIGGVNPTNEDPRRRQRMSGTGMSFYLRLWDFDLATALRPSLNLPMGLPTVRRAISTPRTFIPRALLYNDGGFDVSPDGKTLCACAEYWLPEGVDNAMELYAKEQNEPEPHERRKSTLTVETSAAQSRTIAETHSMVAAALMRFSQDGETRISHGRSPSFREGMDTVGRSQSERQTSTTPLQPRALADDAPVEYIPRTPPIPSQNTNQRLSPPSPPGRRFGGVRNANGREVVETDGDNNDREDQNNNYASPPPPPPPPAPPTSRPPHPLSVLSSSHTAMYEVVEKPGGRYVPHVVTVSLDRSKLPSELEHKWPRGKHPGAVAKGYHPRLGQLIDAYPLDPTKASAVTCVKFSPSTDFCLIGFGVREPEGGGMFHPVTSLYRVRGGMAHISTMLSEIDDVNIARFHPDSGRGFVYGTKQGRVRVSSPRPWNFYNS